jgi:hypothetical protein
MVGLAARDMVARMVCRVTMFRRHWLQGRLRFGRPTGQQRDRQKKERGPWLHAAASSLQSTGATFGITSHQQRTPAKLIRPETTNAQAKLWVS